MDDSRTDSLRAVARPGPPTDEVPSGRRRGLVAVAVVLAVAAVLGGAALFVDHRREASAVDAAVARLVEHTDQLVAQQDDLATAVEAARGIRASAEVAVVDDAVLAVLDDQVDHSAWAAEPYTIIGEPSDDLDMLSIQEAFVLDHLATVERAAADLAEAVSAVESAVDR